MRVRVGTLINPLSGTLSNILKHSILLDLFFSVRFKQFSRNFRH